MVGFGSSLRMSRRRGWEDAYLDYQSLRLLLTQIEAVYEEEDWTANGGSGNQLVNEEEIVVVASASDEVADDDDDEGWKRVVGNAWRLTRAIVTGKSYHRYNSGRRPSGRRYPRVTNTNTRNSNNYGANSMLDINNNDEYFDHQQSSRHHNKRRHHKKDNKKDSQYDRALDRGGWRSPGTTDYRDELFLVSDEEYAYGLDETGDGVSEDDADEGEWEDEDSIDEGQYYEDGAQQYSNYSEGFLDGGEDTEDHPNHGALERSELQTDGAIDNHQESYRDCNSPSHQDKSNDDSLFSSKNQVTLLTPNSQDHLPMPDENKRGHRVKFSDSPGRLEPGYETFATAAARRGFLSPGGDNMTVGSPSEEQGKWLKFIPNLLSMGKQQQETKQEQQQKATASEKDPLLLRDSDSEQYPLNQSLDFSPRPQSGDTSNDVDYADDPPHRYTHFSERFQHSRLASSYNGCTLPYPPNLDIGVENKPESALNEVAVILEEEFQLLKPPAPMSTTAFETPLMTELKTITDVEQRSTPAARLVQATALGSTLPMTPMTPPMTPTRPTHVENDTRIGGFGVSLKMIPTESSELLHHSSPTKTPSSSSDFGLSQFYTYKNEGHGYSTSTSMSRHEPIDYSSTHLDHSGGEYDGGDEEDGEEERGTSNMISFYSGGFSLRSPTKYAPTARRNHPRQHSDNAQSSMKTSMDDSSGGNFIMSFLFGRGVEQNEVRENGSTMQSNQLRQNQSRGIVRSVSSERVGHNRHRLVGARQKRSSAAAKRKRALLKRQRKLRRRSEFVPDHLRRAHARAAQITERFRGLLRAEVEKVILFANSRLGELSDTIGSLRYSSYEDGHEEMRKRYPSLADGGLHQFSSSEEDSGIISGASSMSSPPLNRLDDEDDDDFVDVGNPRAFENDSSKDETKKQLMIRDRLRISQPMFQKADFLGEDFSLLSAVDESDAYTAIGVELMHLLKYVCVNIIAVRKICKKHDKLLANRMLGGYYQRLEAEAKKSHDSKRNGTFFHLNEQPQFGGTLSNNASSQSAGYIYGTYDTKIQHIANSTTMQTVSSSLAIALSDFEASQTRSALLGLGNFPSESKSPEQKKIVQYDTKHEVPSPKHQTFTTSRLRDAMAYQISGQCFRGDDESSVASQENGDENASTSSNTALTRLQFVVASIFGLREAARFKSKPMDQFCSRLFMISAGANALGEGLDGCSRETLDALMNYDPDAAYSLSMDALHTSLKNVGRGNVGIGAVMVSSLAAASNGYDQTSNRPRFRRHVAAAMSIDPNGEENSVNSQPKNEYQNILQLNAASAILYLANYYIIVPTAHIHSVSLGSRSSTAVLIGVANLSSIISLLLQTLFMSKPKSFIRKRVDAADFRLPLILCSMAAVTGNILYSYSLTLQSFGLALFGRLLIGFASAEVLNRQLLSTILSHESINREVAKVAKKSMVTIALALLFGSLVDIKVHDKTGFALRSKSGIPLLADAIGTTTPSPMPATNGITIVTVPDIPQPFLPPLPLDPALPFNEESLFSMESIGYVMAFAWCIHLIGLVFFFDLPKKQRKSEEEAHEDTLQLSTMPEEDFDSDSENEQQNLFMSTQESHGDGTFEKLQTMKRRPKKGTPQHTYMESITNVQRLLFSKVAFPTTVAVFFIVKTTGEVLLSSCGTITARYFGWSGARSGTFLGLLASLILPLNTSLASETNYTERGIIKVALTIARYGLLLMLNYESLFLFCAALANCGVPAKNLLTPYDGKIGAAQYMLCFATVFICIITLDSMSLSLLSKVQTAPRQMKKYSIDSGFVVILVASLGRLMGDLLMFAFDFSSSNFFNDIVNSLCFTLIIAFTVGIYFVRKHFFFLI